MVWSWSDQSFKAASLSNSPAPTKASLTYFLWKGALLCVQFDSLATSQGYCSKQASQQGWLFIFINPTWIKEASCLVLLGREFMEQGIKRAQLTYTECYQQPRKQIIYLQDWTFGKLVTQWKCTFARGPRWHRYRGLNCIQHQLIPEAP